MLVAITGVGVLHQYGGIRLVGVDALCPFGGIETFWTVLTAGTLVKQIAVSSLILLAAVLVIAIVFRRAFCGQICPLGALQELAGTLGGRLRKNQRPLAVPQRLDKAARYLKYAVLVFFTLWTFQAAAVLYLQDRERREDYGPVHKPALGECLRLGRDRAHGSGRHSPLRSRGPGEVAAGAP